MSIREGPRGYYLFYKKQSMKKPKFYNCDEALEFIESRDKDKILEYIQNYDHVMYIDSDAHFYMDAPDIMNVIKQYSEKAFLFSGDVNQKHDFELNSGVFIVKNCPKSIQILTEWAYSIDLYYKRLGYYVNDKYYLYNDQGVLQYMYSINFANIIENSVVLPYGFLQHFVPGEKFAQQPYIYHMAGSNTKQRIASSQKYWDEINV
jgi:hypothetical protein